MTTPVSDCRRCHVVSSLSSTSAPRWRSSASSTPTTSTSSTTRYAHGVFLPMLLSSDLGLEVHRDHFWAVLVLVLQKWSCLRHYFSCLVQRKRLWNTPRRFSSCHSFRWHYVGRGYCRHLGLVLPQVQLLFDNPILWRKTQLTEQTQMNMMGNLMDLVEYLQTIQYSAVPCRVGSWVGLVDGQPDGAVLRHDTLRGRVRTAAAPIRPRPLHLRYVRFTRATLC